MSQKSLYVYFSHSLMHLENILQICSACTIKALISKANKRTQKILSLEEVTLLWVLTACVGGNSQISSLPTHSASK